MKSSYEICEGCEDAGGGGGHFFFMWRLLLAIEMCYHFWLWNELLMIFLEGA